MKKLILTAAFLAASCVGNPALVPIEGPVERTVERVLERHDAYVNADESLSELGREDALAQAFNVEVLLTFPEVHVTVLSEALEPVMERHDAYVQADPELDELDRAIYLESTDRLRGVLGAANPNL